MRRTTLLAVTSLVVAGSAIPAVAGPKPKPITKTYTATAPTPDPSNLAGTTAYSVCAMTVPQSYHKTEFKAPGVGKLQVKLDGFSGDWDLLLIDSKGTQVAAGDKLEQATPATPTTESMTAKIKKAGAVYTIVACNWAGGPTGTVTYTFTYA